jgi:excisionase family DNA binding protein
MESDHNLITVKEAAKYLNIPAPTVYYLVNRGELYGVRIGRRWRLKKDLLDTELLKRSQGNQPSAPSMPTVLVVDDDKGLQSMFKLFLKKQGYARVVVGTGREAISELKKHPGKFALCFLDLQLPDITGDEVYKQAKELQPDLPIVIITGYPDSEMLDNILKFGMVPVLKKPLRVEVLLQAMKMLGHDLKTQPETSEEQAA